MVFWEQFCGRLGTVGIKPVCGSCGVDPVVSECRVCTHLRGLLVLGKNLNSQG